MKDKIVTEDYWTGILVQIGKGIYRTTAGDELFKPSRIRRHVYLIDTGVILQDALLIQLVKCTEENSKYWLGKPVQQALFIAKTDLNLMKKAARQIKIYKPISNFNKKTKGKRNADISRNNSRNNTVINEPSLGFDR